MMADFAYQAGDVFIFGPESRGLPEAMRQTGLVGTAEQILERLGLLARAGVQRVFLQHLVHDDLETVALVGQAIVPEAAAL